MRFVVDVQSCHLGIRLDLRKWGCDGIVIIHTNRDL